MVVGSDGLEMLADLQAGEAELLVAGVQRGLQRLEGRDDFFGRDGGLEGFFDIGLLPELALARGEGRRGSLGKGLEGPGLGAFWECDGGSSCCRWMGEDSGDVLGRAEKFDEGREGRRRSSSHGWLRFGG